MIQPTEAALSAIYPSAQLTFGKRMRSASNNSIYFIKETSSANLSLCIFALPGCHKCFLFLICQQYYRHSHAEVRAAMVEAWVSALVMISTLSASESMCSLCCCLTAGPFQNKFEHRLMLYALTNQHSSLNLSSSLALPCPFNN